MNLILIFPEEIDPSGRVRLMDQRAVHIRKILRAEPGKTLRVGRLNGPFGEGTVEQISAESVTLFCEWESRVPPRPMIDLLLAMPRPKVLKRLWAQFAALGVGRIILTNAEKVERYYFDTHVLDPDFYKARFIEGLQQARDTLLPEVTIVKNLKPFLENELLLEFGTEKHALMQLVPDIGKKLIADPSGTKNMFQCLEDFGEKVPTIGKRVLLTVGPEGGWTPHELEMFKAHGFELFGLGPRILRTDTACIGLMTLLAESLRKNV